MDILFNTGNLIFAVILACVFGWVMMFFDEDDLATRLSSIKQNKALLLFCDGVFRFGIVLGIYLVMLGIWSISGWGERVDEAGRIVEESEARGELLFMIMMYGGPFILSLMGFGIGSFSNKMIKELKKGKDK